VQGVEGLLAEMAAMRKRVAELEAENASLRAENAALREALEEERRAGKRQAAPFSRGVRKANPKKPGRKPGGSRSRRSIPTNIDKKVVVQVPLILRAAGGIEEIGSTGPILGVLPNPSWHSVSVQLAPGDTVVFYSDGVTEAEIDVEELGAHGLRDLLARGLMLDQVLDKVSTCDDVTMLAVKV